MNQLESLQEDRRRLVTETQKFLDRHTDADGKVSVEVAQTVEARFKDIELLDKQIDRLEAELSKPTSKPIRDVIGDGFNDYYGGTQMARKNFTGISNENYHREFLNAIRDNFRHAVTNEYLRVGALPQGGYLCPTEIDQQIISALSANNICRQICRVITTAGIHRIPIVANKPAAVWLSEGEAMTFSNEEFSEVNLDAYKISCGLKLSRELLEDSAFDIEAHIIEQCSNALANAEESAFLLGDGVGKPKGLLTSLAEVTDAVITSEGAEITTDDLINLEFSLDRPYRKTAAWLLADSAVAQIRRLKDSTGNFIWTPRLAEGENSMLLGYPLYTSAYMPPARSGAIAVVFGDFQRAYTIGDRGGRSIQALHELYAEQDLSAYILRQRVDGKLVDANAIRGLQIR